MTVTIIIPVFNEEATLPELLRHIEHLSFYDKLIIVDDGSIDASQDIVRNFINNKSKCKLIVHPKNLGKGAALRTAFAQAETDIVVIQDADLEYDPTEYEQLLAPVLAGESEAVYGSRFKGQKPKVRYPLFLLGNRILTFLINFLYREQLTDVMTCYKVLKTDIIQDIGLKSNGFAVEVELTSKILKKNIKIKEFPISYKSRSYEQGKKIKWFDGIKCIITIFQVRIKGLK